MTAAVVLAAGAARRFGAQKLLQPLAGRPLVRWAVERALAAGSVERVVVVVGREAEQVGAALDGLPITLVVNSRFASGMSSSLRSGIAALGAETRAALVLLGDQPGVPPALLDALAAAHAATGLPIAAPFYDGQRGNPVLFASSLFPELRTVRGDRGAREMIARDPGRIARVPWPGPAPADVDTPAELASLRRRWHDGCSP